MCDRWMTNSLFSLLQSSPLNLPASSICFLFCWLMLPTDLKYLGILSHVLKVTLLLNKKFFSCRCFARLSPNLENALFSALVTQDGKITLDLMLWCPQARENAKTQMFPTLKNGENASGTGGHRKKKMSIYFFFQVMMEISYTHALIVEYPQLLLDRFSINIIFVIERVCSFYRFVKRLDLLHISIRNTFHGTVFSL